MSKVGKKIEAMRTNPRGWRIDDLKTIAERYGIAVRQGATSHAVFTYPDVTPATVPTRKPIKPVYIKAFLALLDTVIQQETGDMRNGVQERGAD